MPNIVLINPRLKTASTNVYVPLGISYIAGVLERHGHEVQVLDLNVENMKDADILKQVGNAGIVGITGMLTEHKEILRLVDLVKKNAPETKVVLGGPMATTIPEELLRVSRADVIVIGEGENTIARLVPALMDRGDLSVIKGIAYRDNGNVTLTGRADPINDLDAIPFPARHFLKMNLYLRNHFAAWGFNLKGFGKVRSTNLISSRGCPYSCTFCFKDMWGHKWRARSAANIVEEMKLLYSQYGVNGFLFNDDTFVLNRERVFEFCRLLNASNMKVIWYCNGRVNLMTRPLLQAMRDAGCVGICYGIESGNQQVLEAMKKNTKLDQIRDVVQWTKEAGLHVAGYFMIGMLGETRASIEQTFAFARELNLDFYGFSVTTPLFGTELYDQAMEKGLIDGVRKGEQKEWSVHVNANLTRDCSNADLVAYDKKAFREFYIQKRFGKYYLVNPRFWKETAKVLVSVRNKAQLVELAGKARSIFQ
ncbi:MAG: cobalamin B12-binding domain-containing protein [Chloroflexi bacterium]|nr:cobalamin B12-binding domain-containing protein [Chloroflexota bacterium]